MTIKYDISVLFPHISEIPHGKIILKSEVINILLVKEHVM